MELKTEIFNYFKPRQTVYLATSQAGRPFVRPVILIYQAEKFWVATGTEDKKVGQICANDQIEFCLPFNVNSKHGYLRGSGRAMIVASEEAREMIYQEARFIHNYWDSHAHPGFTLLRLELKEIEYMRPGNSTTDKLRLI